MNEKPSDQEHWSRVADEWIDWARAPGHDVFWAYRGSLAAFIGQGTGEALEVGCGEGRVSRELKALGYQVTASDPVAAMIDAAQKADSAHDYSVADAANVPFEEGRFDLVVAYNMLMDVEDVPAVLEEIRRVLRPTGQLMISIVHPFADRGRFVGAESEAPFVIEGPYYGRHRFEVAEERDGLRMHFAGWSQPLEDYASALENAGLAITALREPIPDFGQNAEHLKKWTRIPLFLWLKTRPLTSGS